MAASHDAEVSLGRLRLFRLLQVGNDILPSVDASGMCMQENEVTFDRVFTYWEKVNLTPIRIRNQSGAVRKFRPSIDPLPEEIASWEKTFDEGTEFQVGQSVWMSRDQFQLTLDERI